MLTDQRWKQEGVGEAQSMHLAQSRGSHSRVPTPENRHLLLLFPFPFMAPFFLALRFTDSSAGNLSRSIG